MDPNIIYWAGILLFFAMGLGLLFHTRALGKRLIWLYLLLSTVTCGYVELRILNKQFLPSVFRDTTDVLLLLPIPTLTAAILLLALNVAMNKLPERWFRRRISILEVFGTALAGHFLFRLLIQLFVYAYVFFVIVFR